MKSRERLSVVEDNLGGFERRVFTIEANGEAFRTLIDGLYSNKVGAVVRELWSNAVDSHAEAGQTEPFQVDVPTFLDPTFRVRDFGVSLSHEDVLGLYSTIFRSTKGETNEQVGKFGLGSKSPFAYGDTFVVIAYLGGLKRTYVANILDDGLPEIRHLNTETTDEPQGFEVSIPVATSDFRAFEREVTRMLLSTSQRPEVSGLSNPVPEPVLSGDGWRIFDRTYDMGNFAVRQGCVMYAVPTVYPQIESDHLLVADVPIGACEVTASRESLSMDIETANATTEAHRRSWAGVLEFINSLTYENRLDEFQKRDQYSFIRGVTRKDFVTLATDKRNDKLADTGSTSLLTYNKAKIGKPEWRSSFSHPDQLTLIVDDIQPGQKFLRRQLRIREYVKSTYGKHARTALVSRKALPRVVRVLGIKPEQIIALSQLPDVQVTRGTGSYTPAGGWTGTAAPKQLPAGSWWVLKRGAVSLAGDFGYYQGKTTNFWRWMREELELLGFQQDQVVYLTQAQADKFDPTGARRLEPEATARASKYVVKNNFSTRFVGSQNMDVFERQFPTYFREYSNTYGVTGAEAYNIVRLRVSDELGIGTDHEEPDTSEIAIATLAGVSFSPTLTGDEIRSKVDEYKKVYPLLFKDGGETLIDFYIRVTNEQENNK